MMTRKMWSAIEKAMSLRLEEALNELLCAGLHVSFTCAPGHCVCAVATNLGDGDWSEGDPGVGVSEDLSVSLTAALRLALHSWLDHENETDASKDKNDEEGF